MTIFKNIAIVLAMFHTLIVFFLLFESRYPLKKTLRLSCAAMLPLILGNTLLFLLLGYTNFTKIILLTCTVPSLIFFYFLAKYRDGRFVFTFCLADTTALEIIYALGIIDFFIPIESGLFMLIGTLVVFPALELFIYKRLRSSYISVQNHVSTGWYTFAMISGLFYLMITISFCYPTLINRRPEYLPAFFLMFLLMPAIYIHIFTTLNRQKKLYELTEQENILKLQVSNLAERMNEFSSVNEKFRMERHNMRHRMLTIAGMLEKKEYDRLYDYVMECNEAIQETQLKRYCSNPVIDAVLASYLQKAEGKRITVQTRIVLPNPLPVNDAELATVFANAIENAVNANEKLEEQDRMIQVKVLTSPCFMLQISNRFDGNVSFDENGVPISHKKGHGFGTRSIVAFCEKYHAFYEFQAKENLFSLRISFDQ